MISNLETIVCYFFMFLMYLATSLMPYFKFIPSAAIFSSEFKNSALNLTQLDALSLKLDYFGGEVVVSFDQVVEGKLKYYKNNHTVGLYSLRKIQALNQESIDLKATIDAMGEKEKELKEEKEKQFKKAKKRFSSMINEMKKETSMNKETIVALAKYASLLPIKDTSLVGGLIFLTIIMGFVGTIFLNFFKRKSGLLVKIAKVLVFLANLSTILCHLFLIMEVRSFADPLQNAANALRVEKGWSYAAFPSLLAPSYGILNVSLFLMLLVFTVSSNFLIKSSFMKAISKTVEVSVDEEEKVAEITVDPVETA